MLISTRGRYALRVMIDLMDHRNQGYVPLKEIAQRQEISEKYLESILKTLVDNHMLRGLRGKGGGYCLTMEPEDYTIYSILSLTEGTLAPVTCLQDDAPYCFREDECRTLNLWKGLNNAVRDYLNGITLADLSLPPTSNEKNVL